MVRKVLESPGTIFIKGFLYVRLYSKAEQGGDSETVRHVSGPTVELGVRGTEHAEWRWATTRQTGRRGQHGSGGRAEEIHDRRVFDCTRSPRGTQRMLRLI